MADPRFYSVEGPFTLGELADITGADLDESADASRKIVDVAPLESAEPTHLSFLDNKKYVPAFETTRAGACIVAPLLAERAPAGTALLLSAAPYKAYALAAQAFYPIRPPEPGIAPTAVIDPSAELGPDCRVDPGAVIGAHASLGRQCWIGANAVIGPGVVIGELGRVGACASLSHCIVGSRVSIYPGARIGQDGFGFASDPSGATKVPQLGRVMIHDDVEIGANTTIDRGSGPDTVVGAGCWIDNLVQIGHNVELGRGCAVAGQVGISGSTKIGNFVFLGGQVGISGHLRIGDGAKVAAQAGLMRDVEPGATLGGTPAVAIRDWHRQTAALAKLTKKRSRADE